MVSIAEKETYCFHGHVRTTFTEDDKEMELSHLYDMRDLFTDRRHVTHFPVAVFAWKLLDITEIWEQKKPNFLESIQNQLSVFTKTWES